MPVLFQAYMPKGGLLLPNTQLMIDEDASCLIPLQKEKCNPPKRLGIQQSISKFRGTVPRRRCKFTRLV